MNTQKPSAAIVKLIQNKMARINQIKKEAEQVISGSNDGQIKELLALQEELKELSSQMMPHIKNSLIKKIINEKSNYA